MAHDQCTKNVCTAGNFIGHDAGPRLELIVVAAEFPEAGNGRITGAVGVMDGRAIDGLAAIISNGEFFGNAKGFAMSHDHACNGVVRDPTGHEGVHAHPGQANLAARSIVVLVGEWRQFFFMCAPAHFGSGGAFFTKALNAPGVYEFIDFFGTIRNLRVSLAAVNDLHAQFVRKVVEGM